MAMLGTILMIVGYILAGICGIWLLVVAFKESIGWGICCLLIPFASLVFVITHWPIAKKPFLYSLVGAVVAGIGAALTAAGSGT